MEYNNTVSLVSSASRGLARSMEPRLPLPLSTAALQLTRVEEARETCRPPKASECPVAWLSNSRPTDSVISEARARLLTILIFLA